MATKKLRLDFSKVEERSGWNTKVIPDGLHAMKIVGVEVGEAKDGVDMLTYALVPESSTYKTRRFPYYCKIQPNQLFKIRDLATAAGVTIPKKVVNFDPSSIVGKVIAAEVSEETGQYAGRSTIDGTYDVSILDDEDAPASSEDEDEEYEGEEDEADEVEDDETEDADDEEDEEDEDDERREELEAEALPALRKIAKGLEIATAGLKKDDLIEAILEAEAEADEDDEDELDDEDLEDEDLGDEELEDDEDEEEDEEPEPVRRKKAPAKAAPKAAAKALAKRVVKRR